MSSIDEVVATVSEKLSSAEPFGKKILFMLDGDPLYLDGTTNPPSVATTEGEADVTITATLADFVKVLNKQMNPQMAFMMGKIKLKGDMMAAMVLQKIF